MKTFALIVIALSIASHGYRLISGRLVENPGEWTPSKVRNYALVSLITDTVLLVWIVGLP